MSNCRSCNKPIKWIKTPGGKNHPVDAEPEKRWVFIDSEDFPELQGWNLMDTYTSHFATCPQADKWRRDEKPKPALATIVMLALAALVCLTLAGCVSDRGGDIPSPFEMWSHNDRLHGREGSEAE